VGALTPGEYQVAQLVAIFIGGPLIILLGHLTFGYLFRRDRDKEGKTG